MRVKEPGRKSPVFREGSGGKRGRDADRREREKMVSPGVSPAAGPMPEGVLLLTAVVYVAVTLAAE